jgi:hypothetical protein
MIGRPLEKLKYSRNDSIDIIHNVADIALGNGAKTEEEEGLTNVVGELLQVDTDE